MEITTSHYLIVSAILFSIGTLGVMLRRNVIIIFMSIELMLNAVNLTFVTFSRYWNNMDGHIFSFMVMVVAAAEAAIGLAIVIAIYRNKPTANVDDLNLLKG